MIVAVYPNHLEIRLVIFFIFDIFGQMCDDVSTYMSPAHDNFARCPKYIRETILYAGRSICDEILWIHFNRIYVHQCIFHCAKNEFEIRCFLVCVIKSKLSHMTKIEINEIFSATDESQLKMPGLPEKQILTLITRL